MPPSPSIDTMRYGPSRSDQRRRPLAGHLLDGAAHDTGEIVTAGSLGGVGRQHAAHQYGELGVGGRLVHEGVARGLGYSEGRLEQLPAPRPSARESSGGGLGGEGC